MRDDWKEILKKAWSVRALMAIALLTGLDAIFPMVKDHLTWEWSSILTFTMAVLGVFVRLVKQDNLTVEKKDEHPT